jgi:hypothetical protein
VELGGYGEEGQAELVVALKQILEAESYGLTAPPPKVHLWES